MKQLLKLLLLMPFCLAQAQDASPMDSAAMEAMIADGQAEALEELMESALKEDPDSAQAHYWLGRAELASIDDASAFRKLGLARSARKNLEKAVSLDPALVPARISLARYYLEAPAIAGGDDDAAMDQAEQILALDAAAGYRIKGAIARSEEDYEQAVSWMRQALAAGPWEWAAQYELIVLAVHQQVGSAVAALDEAQSNVRAHAENAGELLPLIDYQRGKLAAVSGNYLESGQLALERYLLHTPAEGEPDLEWAQFRLSQVERQLGSADEALARLEGLESSEVPEDLSFAIRDERRWHYSD